MTCPADDRDVALLCGDRNGRLDRSVGRHSYQQSLILRTTWRRLQVPSLDLLPTPSDDLVHGLFQCHFAHKS